MADLKYQPRRRRRRPVAVDFDGVLHDKPKGTLSLGSPHDGAQEFIKWLLRHGFDPHIHTARSKHTDVVEWLQKHKFPPMLVTNVKQPAEVYIDDRAMRFMGRFDQLKKRLLRGTDPWTDGK